MRNLLKKLNNISGLPIRLKDAKVTKDMLHEVAKAAINDGALVYNPKDVTYEDALEIYRKAF